MREIHTHVLLVQREVVLAYLLDAAVVLGAHLDAPEGHVDDEMIVRALSAFMVARQCSLASLEARYDITLDSGPPSTRSRQSVLEVARRLGLTA